MLKYLIIAFVILIVSACKTPIQSARKSLALVSTKDVRFSSKGIDLAGTIYKPENPLAGVVLVHGSDRVPRMTSLAERLAKESIMVLTYDKRGVGESGGIYAGPELGTNNISVENLNLLAEDVSEAVDILQAEHKNLPIGLVGFSQAGWIIPIAANRNQSVRFMVMFSCPTITTLEQLRFQFYTNGRTDFWDHHTESEAREHIGNDPDRYQFEDTDPKNELTNLDIPGLWLFGEKDIQIPAKLCIEQLEELKKKEKPFEYVLFPDLGHNTNSAIPIEASIHWIKEEALGVKQR